MNKHIARFMVSGLLAAFALMAAPVGHAQERSPFCDYIHGFTLDTAGDVSEAVSLGQPPVNVVAEGIYSADESFVVFAAVDDLLPINDGEIITVVSAPLPDDAIAGREPEAVEAAALTARDGVVIRKLRAYDPTAGTSSGIRLSEGENIAKIRVASGNGIPMTVYCTLEPINIQQDETPEIVVAESAAPELDLSGTDLPESGLTGQFNHGDIVQAGPDERPQLTVQFGNSSQEAVQDVSLDCIMDGAATFTDPVAIYGAFANADQSDKGLSFGPPVLSINPGQNYNVTLAVNPVEGTSTVTCALTTPEFAPVVFTQAVGLR